MGFGSAIAPPSAAGGPCSFEGRGLSPAQLHHRGTWEMAPPSVCAGASLASCGLFSGAGSSPAPFWRGSDNHLELRVVDREPWKDGLAVPLLLLPLPTCRLVHCP